MASSTSASTSCRPLLSVAAVNDGGWSCSEPAASGEDEVGGDERSDMERGSTQVTTGSEYKNAVAVGEEGARKTTNENEQRSTAEC